MVVQIVSPVPVNVVRAGRVGGSVEVPSGSGTQPVAHQEPDYSQFLIENIK